MYKSARELFRDWPMSQYSEGELEILQRIAIANKAEICVRLWGREYAHFYPNGKICPFEHEEFAEDDSMELPPKNDKWVFYRFELAPLEKKDS